MLEPKLPVEGLLGTWGRVLPHSHAQHQLGVGLGSVVSMWIWWWILGGSSGGLQPGLLPVAGRLSGTYYGCHVRASGARKGQWGGGGGGGGAGLRLPAAKHCRPSVPETTVPLPPLLPGLLAPANRKRVRAGLPTLPCPHGPGPGLHVPLPLLCCWGSGAQDTE